MPGRIARSPIARTGVTLLVLALAGCGSRDSDPPAPPPSVSAEESAANAPLMPSAAGSAVATATGTVTPSASVGPQRVSSAPAPATASPPPRPSNTAACKTSHLAVRVIRQPANDVGRQATALLALTNTGPRTCGLSGWPTVALTRGGATIGLPTTNVNEPRRPVGIALVPNRTAFAGIRWRSCTPAERGCRTGTELQIATPGSRPATAELIGFEGPEHERLAMTALQIGPLQPTTTDILAW